MNNVALNQQYCQLFKLLKLKLFLTYSISLELFKNNVLIKKQKSHAL